MRSSVYCCFGKLFLEEYYSKKFFFSCQVYLLRRQLIYVNIFSNEWKRWRGNDGAILVFASFSSIRNFV